MRKPSSVLQAVALTILAAVHGEGCARTEVNSAIIVLVIDESTRIVDGSKTESIRSVASNTRVYLQRASSSANAVIQPDWSYELTNNEGRAQFRGVEGYFDVIVDRNGDSLIDAVKRNVASGTQVTVFVRGTTYPTEPTEVTNTDPVTKPPTVTSPPQLLGMWINGGVTEVTSYDVEVTFSAKDVVALSLTENPPSYGPRFPFIDRFGYHLSYGQGSKTLFAFAYGGDGSMAGPVSTSVVVKTGPPYPPIINFLRVTENWPGNDDFLEGLPGTVEGRNVVRVYANQQMSVKITDTVSNGDGSFGPISIGDGVVEKPDDLVYVTSVDIFQRESLPAWIENDSTGPLNFKIDGYWQRLYEPWDIGTRGEIFYVTLNAAFAGGIAFDVAGGTIFVPPFDGNTIFSLPPNPPKNFQLPITVPSNRFVDIAGPVTAYVWDSAGNQTYGQAEVGILIKTFELNAAPPSPVVVNAVYGGNRSLRTHWSDPNSDSSKYVLVVQNEIGSTVFMDEISWLEYMCLTGDINNYSGGQLVSLQACFPDYPVSNAKYWYVSGLANCHWYSVSVQTVDSGLNRSVFSAPVSDYVIIPTPNFLAWGGLADPSSGFGTVYFNLSPVPYASAYELLFAESPGPPYSYDSGLGAVSPATFSSVPTSYGSPSIDGLPYGKTFFLSARALDGSCASYYAPETSAMTDLRTYARFDGSPDDVLGTAVANAGDNNLDAQSEILVGSAGTRSANVVSAPTGSTISTLSYFFAAPQLDLPGTPLAALDLDGDSSLEYLIGSPLESPAGIFMAGSTYLFSGSGALLKRFDGDAQGLQFGHTVAAIGDLNGDGVPEFAIGSVGCEHRDCLWGSGGATEGPSSVDVIDGQTLTIFRAHIGNNGDLLGAALAGGFDYDGDGVHDYVAGAPAAVGHGNAAYVAVFSGLTGTSTMVGTSGGNGRFGAAVTVGAIGGTPVIFIGEPGQADGDQGYVSAITYGAGEWGQIWRLGGASVRTSSRFGTSLAIAPYVRNANRPTLLVGAPGSIQDYAYGAGSVFALDALTGAIQYEVRGSTCDGALGFSLLTLPQLNALPASEWLASAPGSACNGYQSGRIYIFSTDPP